jgi:glycosyltransferase involved in cell wall biosynthesis
LNEEATIAGVIARIPRDIPGITETGVVVVDDGSTDRTSELSRAAGAEIVRHEKPRGVGAAFRSGLEASSRLGADIIVTIDADGQFNPEDIPKLVEPILRGEAEFVTASRFKDPALVPQMPPMKRWGNDVIARWISRIIRKKFDDVSCGFRAYSRKAYLRLVLLGEFTYTHETFICLAYARVPMAEVPLVIRGVREHGQSRVASNLFRYAGRTASIILRTYRDYQPLRFFGYLALVNLSLGFGFLTFLAQHWVRTGGVTPHKWAGFTGGFFAITGLMLFIVGILAEMLDRMRVTQEETLFRVRMMEMDLRDRQDK